jgi:hypothetical protein
MMVVDILMTDPEFTPLFLNPLFCSMARSDAAVLDSKLRGAIHKNHQ